MINLHRAVRDVSKAVTYAVGEKDKQAAKHHRKVANKVASKYSKLKNRYEELAEKNRKQIAELTCQLALSEAEKDLMRLAIRLQQRLIALMFQIDKRPSRATLNEFKLAVLSTNWALSKLNEETTTVPDNYLTCNLARAKKIENNTEPKKIESHTESN